MTAAPEGARKKLNRPTTSQSVVQSLEAINEVSDQLAKGKEDKEVDKEAEKTIQESLIVFSITHRNHSARNIPSKHVWKL